MSWMLKRPWQQLNLFKFTSKCTKMLLDPSYTIRHFADNKNAKNACIWIKFKYICILFATSTKTSQLTASQKLHSVLASSTRNEHRDLRAWFSVSFAAKY